jgi:virginiamycin B lyase
MMMQPGAYRAALALAAVAILGGCGGSSLGSLPATGSAGPAGPASSEAPAKHRGKGKVAVRMLIPRAPRHRRGRALRPFFVATSTQGVKIVVYAHGSSTPLATTAAGIGPGSPLCHAVTGGRSCTVSAEAPVGNDDFKIVTYDAQPSGGSFTGAKQLGIGTTNTTVVSGQANSIGVTIGGVVAKSTVQLSSPNAAVIDSDTQTVTVGAQDADGNAIVSDGWYDAGGNAVTMAIASGNISPISLGIVPSTATFAAPTATLTYTSSQASTAQVQNGLTTQITATPSNGATAGGATLTLLKPAFTEYATGGTGTGPEGIEVGPDGAIWFAESVGNAIGRVATNAAAGSAATEYTTGISANASPRQLANDNNGLIWFTEFGLGKVASITTAGTVHEYAGPDGASSFPYGIVKDNSGNMWFAENCVTVSKMARFDPTNVAASMASYATATSMSSPQQVALGPDGNVWFTETASSVNKIGKITTGLAPVATDYQVPGTGNIYQGGIASGPSDSLWFAECNNNPSTNGDRIGSVTTSGTVAEYPQLATSQSNPVGVAVGPDGAVWFAENGNNAIGRIDPVNHTYAEFAVPTAASGPWGIVKGPDGALWFTENDKGKIGRLQ